MRLLAAAGQIEVARVDIHATIPIRFPQTEAGANNRSSVRGHMLNRRTSISLIAALPAVFGLWAAFVPRACASPAGDRAAALITTAGGRLVAAINGTGTLEQRHKLLGGIIDDSIDVNGVAHFCLGRFWRIATPAQQQQYLGLFRNALIVNIASKIGEFQGVRFTVGSTQDRDAGELVSTVIERPNNSPVNVQWVVANAGTDPKVVDVIAEGTSLRITQRDDYASFLNQHDDSIDALLGAIRHQLDQNG
jgi:phospholipid transport system substrate-binding protein